MLRQNLWKHVLCRQALYISEFLFIIMTCLSHSFLRIVKRSSIHWLKLNLLNIFIAPIGLSCFTTLNVMYLRKSVRDVVVLKCCSKWAANGSDFCPFLSSRRRLKKWPSIVARIRTSHTIRESNPEPRHYTKSAQALLLQLGWRFWKLA